MRPDQKSEREGRKQNCHGIIIFGSNIRHYNSCSLKIKCKFLIHYSTSLSFFFVCNWICIEIVYFSSQWTILTFYRHSLSTFSKSNRNYLITFFVWCISLLIISLLSRFLPLAHPSILSLICNDTVTDTVLLLLRCQEHWRIYVWMC